MLAKRIIAALDVQKGRVVKGIKFQNIVETGDPIAQAIAYEEHGIDEIVFLDISASRECRGISQALATDIAKAIHIPFMVGGGLSTVEEIVSVIKAGADKVFVNSAAVKNPSLIEKAASVIGSANLCVAIDAKWEAGGYEVYVNGGSEATGLDALVWAKEAQRLGAGEILITSMDADGVKQGFDIPLNRSLSEAVDLPVIASGGAGKTEDFLEVFSLTAVSGALAASVFHYGEIEIRSLKNYLIENGVSIRHERNG